MCLLIGLEGPTEPSFDVFNSVAGFFLHFAEPFVLLAVLVGQVVIGEVAPLLLGFALYLVPVAASFQLGLVVDVILVDIHDSSRKCEWKDFISADLYALISTRVEHRGIMPKSC